MAEAADSGQYDLPRREGSDHVTPVEGMIATVMTRLDSFRSGDGTRRQRHRSRAARGGRDGAAAARPSSTPASCATACPATRRPRSWRSRRRSACARPAASTATTASPARTCWALAASTTRWACAARPSRTTTRGADTRWQYLPDGEVVGIPYRHARRARRGQHARGRALLLAPRTTRTPRSAPWPRRWPWARPPAPPPPWPLQAGVDATRGRRGRPARPAAARRRRARAVGEDGRHARRHARERRREATGGSASTSAARARRSGSSAPTARSARPSVAETDHQPFETVWERAPGRTPTQPSRSEGRDGLRGVGHRSARARRARPSACATCPARCPGIEDFPMRERLEARLGVPVRCVNDGAAATLAEWRFGAARGYEDVVGPDPGHRPRRRRHPGRPAARLSAPRRPASPSAMPPSRSAAGPACAATSAAPRRSCRPTRSSGRMRDYVARKVPSTITEAYEHDPGASPSGRSWTASRPATASAIEILAALLPRPGRHHRDRHPRLRPRGRRAGRRAHGPGRPLPAPVQAYVDRYAFRYPKDRIIPILRAERSDHAGVLGAVALVMQATEDAGASRRPTRQPPTCHSLKGDSSMAFARTVLGDIATDELGIVYAHEHLVIHGGRPVQLFPDFELADVDKAVAELAPAQALGLRTVVDAMPADCGRDVLLLAEIVATQRRPRHRADRSPPRALLPRPPLERAPLRRRDRRTSSWPTSRRASTSSTTTGPSSSAPPHRAGRHEDRRLDGRPQRPRRAGLRRRGHGPAPHGLPHPDPLRGRHGRPRAGRGPRAARRRPGAHRALARGQGRRPRLPARHRRHRRPGRVRPGLPLGRQAQRDPAAARVGGRGRSAGPHHARAWTPPARATGRSSAARPAGPGCSTSSLP